MLPVMQKEFREVRRDRRTLALMIFVPVLLLVIFGYAANFDVSDIPTAVVGPGAKAASAELQEPFRAVDVDPDGDRSTAEAEIQRGDAMVGIVTGDGPPTILIDGTELFVAQTTKAALARKAPDANVEILYNPDLETSAVMVPGIIGLILVFIGIVITSLGITRERESGALEQLAVMPLRASGIIAGKIVPYFVIAAVDMALVTVAGILLFDVPMRGSVALLALGAALFLLVALGLGILISTVSQNAGQAIQLALMVLLPQVLLSGLIFPLESMAVWVRWIAYALPLTWFIEISRGVMLKDQTFRELLLPLGVLAFMAVVVFGLAIARFRRDLGARVRSREKPTDSSPATGSA